MIGSELHLSKEETIRYGRHVIIPDFGLNAQLQLKAARVLVVGAGGLGSPLLLYLAAAGVGRIGIIDFDVVDDSNLQRQVLFDVSDVGELKVQAASQRLRALNPFIEVIPYSVRLTKDNAKELFNDYDVIADGTDNFATRYLVNDACVLLNKPNVFASIFQFEGQVSVFNYRMGNGKVGPNYRDLYAEPPPSDLIPSCAVGGVLGVLPGIIGSMQALEVIKIITGVGEPLSGRLFHFDALTFESRVYNIARDPANPLNGLHQTQHELIDYELLCNGVQSVRPPVKEITAQELAEWKGRGEDFQLIDVREPYEYDIVNLGAELIPSQTILDAADRIDRIRKVVIHCKSGARSEKAIRELEEKDGRTNLFNLKGGIKAYMENIEHELLKY